VKLFHRAMTKGLAIGMRAADRHTVWNGEMWCNLDGEAKHFWNGSTWRPIEDLAAGPR